MDEEFNHELGSPFVREVYDWIESGITAIVCVILLFTFVGRLVGVDGDSMLNTLRDQDRLVATNFMYKPSRSDIVVVTKPNDRNEPLIKRVIAVGGQTLEINFEAGEIFVDGRRIDEPYIREEMDPDSYSDFEFPLVIPDGHIFIMGDNRNHSWDSRYEGVGLVDERHVLGKVIYRVMPYSDIGVPDNRKQS